MAIVLNASNTTVPLTGGKYKVATTFNGGTAQLDVQFNGSENWYSCGVLSESPQPLDLPLACKVRLTATGGAFVEISR